MDLASALEGATSRLFIVDCIDHDCRRISQLLRPPPPRDTLYAVAARAPRTAGGGGWIYRSAGISSHTTRIPVAVGEEKAKANSHGSLPLGGTGGSTPPHLNVERRGLPTSRGQPEASPACLRSDPWLSSATAHCASSMWISPPHTLSTVATLTPFSIWANGSVGFLFHTMPSCARD